MPQSQLLTSSLFTICPASHTGRVMLMLAMPGQGWPRVACHTDEGMSWKGAWVSDACCSLFAGSGLHLRGWRTEARVETVLDVQSELTAIPSAAVCDGHAPLEDTVRGQAAGHACWCLSGRAHAAKTCTNCHTFWPITATQLSAMATQRLQR